MSIAVFLEANAGTGKTTRLTEAMIGAVAGGTSLERICAVTFTDKAANEMVERLRSKLVERIGNREFPPAILDQMNRCFIGTMHGFCTQLLKRHGDRLGLPPIFEVDDGSHYESLFQARWDRFISRTLRRRNTETARLISLLGIQGLQSLAETLASRRSEFHRPDSSDPSWLISDLRNAGRWGVNPEGGWNQVAMNALQDFEKNRTLLLLLCDGNHIENPWRDAIRDAIHCRTAEMYEAIDLLQREFVRHLLREYRSLGYLRFDDLLIDARDLLRNHRDIRRRLKARYDRVLLDEMQDTDPVQYEILLYICEKNDREDNFGLEEIVTGRSPLRLQEDKLFVVGDPKQSIYGFRSADINAYDRVRDLLEREGVAIEPLAENFRSCSNLVSFTNELARRLFAPRIPSPSTPGREYCPGKRMEDCVHVVRIISPEADAQHLRVLSEANWLADKIRGLRAEGIAYSDIGILFRKLTNAHLYVDALSARNIPIVIEGEKFLYRTQEVIDLLNLLKCIVDEMDPIALAGALRSPLFGLNDLELALFFQPYNAGSDAGTALGAALQDGEPGRLAVLRSFLEHIAEIRRMAGQLTPGRLMDEVLSRFPVLSVAGIAYGPHRRELAPLNILKIHKGALEADLNPEITTDGFVRMQELFSVEGKETEQETTADEAVQAVRLLSIHKSKGLDFPVVFVPLTDHGTAGFPQRTAVIHDWETGKTGIKINGFTEDNYLSLRYREDEPVISGDPMLAEIDDEERRVLYVAATRAKHRMYFSFVEKVAGKDSSQGFLLFEFLKTLHASVQEVPEPSTPWFPAPEIESTEPHRSLQEALQNWDRVVAARKEASLPPSRTVTAEAAIHFPWDAETDTAPQDSSPLLVGNLCHGVLEKIDFASPDNLDTLLEIEAAKLLEGYAPELAERAKAEAMSILQSFLRSPAARRLASADILGREVPVALFDSDKIITGQIDIIIRENDTCAVIDYKTNRSLNDHDLAVYGEQLSLYAKTIAPLLPAPPVLLLCLLRTGEFITLSPDA